MLCNNTFSYWIKALKCEMDDWKEMMGTYLLLCFCRKILWKMLNKWMWSCRTASLSVVFNLQLISAAAVLITKIRYETNCHLSHLSPTLGQTYELHSVFRSSFIFYSVFCFKDFLFFFFYYLLIIWTQFQAFILQTERSHQGLLYPNLCHCFSFHLTAASSLICLWTRTVSLNEETSSRSEYVDICSQCCIQKPVKQHFNFMQAQFPLLSTAGFRSLLFGSDCMSKSDRNEISQHTRCVTGQAMGHTGTHLLNVLWFNKHLKTFQVHVMPDITMDWVWVKWKPSVSLALQVLPFLLLGFGSYVFELEGRIEGWSDW